MRRAGPAGAVLVASVAAAWALAVGAPGPGAVEAAAEALSVPAGEPEMQRIVRIAGSPNASRRRRARSRAGGPGVRGREAVAGLAAQLSGIAGLRAVALTDIEVAFDETKPPLLPRSARHDRRGGSGVAVRRRPGHDRAQARRWRLADCPRGPRTDPHPLSFARSTALRWPLTLSAPGAA